MNTPHPPARHLDRLMVLAAALLFSTGGAAIKSCAMTSWQVASFRSGIAAVTIVLLLPAARRGWTWRTWVVGVAYATTLVLYALANKLTTAANATFLQGTAPLYVLLLSPWLLGERARGRDLALMAAMATGLAMFFVGEQPRFDTAPQPMLGNLIAVGAGVAWGLTIMGLRWLGRGHDPSAAQSAAAVACGNLIACCASLPMALPVRSASVMDWGMIAYLGVFQVAVAYVFLTRGLARVGALEASLLLLAEPVFNPLWAFLVHGELSRTPAVIGGAIIIVATVARAFGRDPSR